MSETLSEVAEGVWSARAPFRFLGLFAVGARMTVLRLGDDLLVHSPIEITPGLKAAVETLGSPRYIVAPNAFHHVFASSAQAAWPEATLLAPAKLREKRPDLRIDRDLEGPAPEAWGDHIDAFPVRGCLLAETALYHRASRTLVGADLFENFATSDDLLTRAYLKAGGIHGKPGWSRLFRVVYRDRKAALASVAPMFELDLARVVVSHGEILTERPRETLREVFAFLDT